MVIVIFPVFLYQEFWLRKDHSLDPDEFKSNILGGLCIITGILCISFQVEAYEGHLFDLRTVPLLISYLYGGVFSGISTSIILVLFRFGLGGDGVIVTIINVILVSALSLVYLKKFHVRDRNFKTIYFGSLVFASSIIKAILTMMWLDRMDLITLIPLFTLFTVTSLATTWIMINLLENIREKLLMEREIQTAEKLNVIGHMAASVAHEIRNPLTVIRGFLQIFRRESFIPESKRNHFKLMIQELDRAETMINDYLSLARPQMKPQEVIEVKTKIEFVHEIISSYALLKGVQLKLEIAPGLKIRADAEKFNQVIINLVKNAIEASPSDGTVIITARAVQHLVQIKVIDYGVGISKEQLARIGSPFFSTKENGTGLGLMVCYRIVEAMEGELIVNSEVGKGSQFTIMLPAVN